jgi:glycosyltransferase involved in cell wall biosynthesis
MHVVMIVDDERLQSEQPMLNRLALGLMDENVRLTRLVPHHRADDEAEQRMAPARRVAYPVESLPWRRMHRARELLKAIGHPPPDAVYATGDGARRIGHELATAAGCPLALEVWEPWPLGRLVRRHRLPSAAAYIVPTRALQALLRERIDPDLISLVPIGVPLPREPTAIFTAENPFISIAVIGSGRDVTGYRTMLTAIRGLVRDQAALQVFMELRGSGEHEIWQHARSLEILDHLSTLTSAGHHRSLLTRCDLLIAPEREAEVRSLVPEAMAHGLPVIVADARQNDAIRPGETAELVTESTESGWRRAIQGLLENPQRAIAMGAAGRAVIAARHRSSDQVRLLAVTLRRIVHGETYAFEAAHP